MNRVAGKSCLVTGAAQGIGRSIARALAAEGATVLAADIQVAALETLRNEGFETLRLDVTDPDCKALVAERGGALDVLVNCVGIVPSGTVLDSSAEDFERSFRVNVVSMVNMIQAVLPGMVERGSGSIINIASVVSTTKAAPDRCAYSATKAAVLALTRSVALDFAASGVRCNSISPGTVASPSLEERIAAAADPVAARARFLQRQPAGRLGTAEEVAELAVLLASDEARFMTGSDLVIDGGMSL